MNQSKEGKMQKWEYCVLKFDKKLKRDFTLKEIRRALYYSDSTSDSPRLGFATDYVRLPNNLREAYFNWDCWVIAKLGENGWEMVNHVTVERPLAFDKLYFKRPIEE
jgi:hypothetical protein